MASWGEQLWPRRSNIMQLWPHVGGIGMGAGATSCSYGLVGGIGMGSREE